MDATKEIGSVLSKALDKLGEMLSVVGAESIRLWSEMVMHYQVRAIGKFAVVSLLFMVAVVISFKWSYIFHKYFNNSEYKSGDYAFGAFWIAFLSGLFALGMASFLPNLLAGALFPEAGLIHQLAGK